MREFPPSHPTAPAQLGLLGAWGFWSPVGSLPASLWWRCGPGIEQSPGNARPWWEGLGLSLTILGALRHPCKVWPAQREGRHLARHDLYPSLGGGAPSHLSHSSPHTRNSWCFQGNYLMNQQCGDCGGRMAQEESFSQH